MKKDKTITINSDNIGQYLVDTQIYPNINAIEWDAGSINESVLSLFPNTRNFVCKDAGLTDVDVRVCAKLLCLDARRNKIASLRNIKTSPELKYLWCEGNALATLDGLEAFSQLKLLEVRANHLVSLEGIDVCTQLDAFYCESNEITTLVGIENCTLLDCLNCSHNRITSLAPIVYLRHLSQIAYWDNPLDVQTIQVQRVLDQSRVSRSIYSDTQNVHDTHIQRTVCESIQRLLTDPKPEFAIEAVLESDLDEKAKALIVEYCSDDTIHSVHLLTYAELLGYVWQRIEQSEHRSELLAILAEQVTDAECKCFTGRFNRTLSVLVGFYDDIVIEISDNSRIGAIIIAIKQGLDVYNPVEHRTRAKTALLEAGYTDEDMEPWLDAIIEVHDGTNE